MFREITKITNVLEAQVIQNLNENTPVGGGTVLFGTFSRFDRNAFFSLFYLCLYALCYPISYFPATLGYFLYFPNFRGKEGGDKETQRNIWLIEATAIMRSITSRDGNMKNNDAARRSVQCDYAD